MRGPGLDDPWVARDRYVRPLSLAEFLERGGSVEGFPLLASLAEAVVVGRRVFPPDVNRRQAGRNRAYVKRWFERHGGEPPVQATQDLLTFAAWKAECLEDEAVAECFEHSIPAALLEEKLRLLDDLKRSHPLTVAELGAWTCRACGSEQQHAAALVVTGLAEGTATEDLTYCASCVSIASAALDAACGVGDLISDLASEGLRLGPATPPSPEGGESQGGEGADEIVLPPSEVMSAEPSPQVAARLMEEIEATKSRLEALEIERSRLVRRILDGPARSARPGPADRDGDENQGRIGGPDPR